MLKTVNKVWGREKWIVNCPDYCGKLLLVHKGASSSLHYHPKKKETFYVLEGKARLTVGNKEVSTPITIEPNTPHRFYGITDTVILEVSTFHSDDDVVRMEESQGASI